LLVWIANDYGEAAISIYCAIFEADFKEKNEPKVDPERRAMLALLHYKASMPFYRQEVLYNPFF
jgi:hypothetical protein